MKGVNFTQIFCISIILLSCSSPETLKDLPVMGGLIQGEHSTGYRTLFVYDKTRSGIPFSDWDGRLYKNHQEENGRQFQINLWYPAETGSGSSINYSHYIHLQGQHTNFEQSATQKKFAEQLFISNTNDLADNQSFTQVELEKLMQLEVTSRLDAEPKEGSYPVILIPDGTPAANYSILAEYLAGHGYVVVGFSPKGRYSSGLEVSTIGLETGVDDLEFALGQISRLPHADMERVAVIANAISSSIGALAVSKNEKIKALISLEGGLPSAFEQRLLNKSASYKPENFKAPTLFIYAPHPAIDPKHTFHLNYAKRYYAHFPKMSEFAMLNYGMFDSIVPDIIGEHDGGTKKGFETASGLVLRFLNKCLIEDKINLFDEDFIAATEGVIDTTYILEALPSPPNMAELKGLFVAKGFSVIDSIYYALVKSGNPQPFDQSFFTDYRDWLSWKKDPEYVNRKKLYELALKSYPESAVINFHAGYFGAKTNDSALKKKSYSKAIELIEKNIDQSLTDSERQSILVNAQKALDIK